MCDDSGKGSVGASSPEIACTTGDRGSKVDSSSKDLIERGHVI